MISRLAGNVLEKVLGYFLTWLGGRRRLVFLRWLFCLCRDLTSPLSAVDLGVRKPELRRSHAATLRDADLFDATFILVELAAKPNFVASL
jgi:hypothetical protein